MYLDSRFAHPVSSYERPVPLVLVDPQSDPVVHVQFAYAWLPYVLGSLQQLLLQSTWKTTDPDALNLVQARAQALIALFTEAGEAVLQDVRQNEELPCTLEKTFDGETWTAFANLQLCPPKVRTGAGGGLEWYDGTGWVPLPDSGDERYDGTSTPPWPSPPSGQTGNCLAAENIVAIFDSSMLSGKVVLEAGQIAFGIITAIAGALTAFMPQATFAAAAAGIGEALFSGGVTFLESVVDPDRLEEFKCAISCNINADGSVTAAQFSEIQDQLALTMSDATIRSIYTFWMDGLGPVGLTRMGAAAGITTGDCDTCDCGWTSTFNFLPSDGGWEAWNDGGGTRAVWLDGVGWNENSEYKKSRMTIQITGFDSAVITHMRITSSAGMSGNENQIGVTYGGTVDVVLNSTAAVVDVAGSGIAVSSIFIDFAEDVDVNGGAVTGETTQIELWGTGTKPSQFP